MDIRKQLLSGLAIPAHPLALDESRRLDERRQRALTRYYLAAGAGGVAVGVHTTQFAIREPRYGLYQPVLELASRTIDEASARNTGSFVKVAGICGRTEQAMAEAGIARNLGYHAGLLSLGAWRDGNETEILAHCRAVADSIPLFGFYLQPAVGGRVLSYRFWREFLEISDVVGIKIAPFNRYQTLDVVRAVAESARDDVALYTGNDDNLVIDLVTRFEFSGKTRRICGGLLGHWAVWTKRAVEMLDKIRNVPPGSGLHSSWLTHAASVTDANGAIFDFANGYAGCIPGIHEVLRRQGLLRGTWCLDPNEHLSPGQSEEIERVIRSYPEMTDDEFVAEHLEEWLK